MKVRSRIYAREYPLTNKYIDCGEYEQSTKRLDSLEKAFDEATDRFIADGKAERISVWARDLRTKQWAAKGEAEVYIPASLLKVPLMIMYFKFAEIRPDILSQTILYNEPAKVWPQDYAASSTLEIGKSYSAEELIERMIIESDNVAMSLLASNIDNAFANTVLTDLGLKVPAVPDNADFVTVKNYANIFRILYNASYINRANSQKALDILSRTKFKGIDEGVPQETLTAHKFGERTTMNADGSLKRELHDCGIVYKKSGPYSICIMTEGKNFDDLYGIIRDLSRITYENI